MFLQATDLASAFENCNLQKPCGSEVTLNTSPHARPQQTPTMPGADGSIFDKVSTVPDSDDTPPQVGNTASKPVSSQLLNEDSGQPLATSQPLSETQLPGQVPAQVQADKQSAAQFRQQPADRDHVQQQKQQPQLQHERSQSDGAVLANEDSPTAGLQTAASAPQPPAKLLPPQQQQSSANVKAAAQACYGRPLNKASQDLIEKRGPPFSFHTAKRLAEQQSMQTARNFPREPSRINGGQQRRELSGRHLSASETVPQPTQQQLSLSGSERDASGNAHPAWDSTVDVRPSEAPPKLSDPVPPRPKPKAKPAMTGVRPPTPAQSPAEAGCTTPPARTPEPLRPSNRMHSSVSPGPDPSMVSRQLRQEPTTPQTGQGHGRAGARSSTRSATPGDVIDDTGVHH